jgi:hypothetical protein
MPVRIVAFILLVCFASGEALAGQVRTRLTSSYLFGDFVVRPPRSIPHARSQLGRSAMAAVPPLPRARPTAAPHDGGIARTSTEAGAPSSAPASDRPSAASSASGFPPVVTLE